MRKFSNLSLKAKITALILAASCIVLFLSSSIFCHVVPLVFFLIPK